MHTAQDTQERTHTDDQAMNDMPTWITFAELGARTRKTSSAVRMWVTRRRAKGDSVLVKKERGKRGDIWYIHSSEAKAFMERDGLLVQGAGVQEQQPEQVNTLTLEYYDGQRKEWLRERDELMSGLLMYRNKYEALERLMHLLPAPVEELPAVLREKEAILQEREHRLQEMETHAQVLMNELEEARRPGWQKLFRAVGMWK